MRALSLSPLALLVSVACAPTVARHPATGDAPRTALVTYQPSPIESIDRARRREAYREMRASCGGAFRILSERQRKEVVTVARSLSSGTQPQPVAYRYIEYSCVIGDAPRE